MAIRDGRHGQTTDAWSASPSAADGVSKVVILYTIHYTLYTIHSYTHTLIHSYTHTLYIKHSYTIHYEVWVVPI